MLSEVFRYLVGKYGRPKKSRPVQPDDFADYAAKLPPTLIDFLTECGIGMWLDGKFQFCHPADYRAVVRLVLKDDAQFKPDRTHLFGYTAFGEIWLWNEDCQELLIKLPVLWAAAPVTGAGWSPSDPDQVMFARLSGLAQNPSADWRDEAGAFLFDRARRTVGDLELGECYGFVPALELGGEAQLGSIRRVKALEHFSLLAQAGPVQLFDYGGGQQRPVRLLGA
jgi:hypothetical protein